MNTEPTIPTPAGKTVTFNRIHLRPQSLKLPLADIELEHIQRLLPGECELAETIFFVDNDGQRKVLKYRVVEPTPLPEPITHGGPDRAYKLCKCSKCGLVEQCTPHRDFYTTDDLKGPLLCETCFWQYARETRRDNLTKP